MSSAEKPNPRMPRRRDPSHFSPSAIIREGPPTGDARLLSFFVDRDGHIVEEPRSSPRFRALVQRAWLGWWSTPSEFGRVAACLEDISLGGARLVTANPPAVQQLVWLCLGNPDPIDCVQAKILAVTPNPAGGHTVRLAFGIPCPQKLYQTAIYGFERTGR
jgi:hypothetical protein